MSKSEWDSQRDDQRKGVIASLDATRLCFRSGRNWATKEPLGTDEDEPLVRPLAASQLAQAFQITT